MSPVRFRSDVVVDLVQHVGDDESIAAAARVSNGGEVDVTRTAGLINYLVKQRHGSPFEHNSLTFRIECPIFVMRELMRHRIASYNETSARYRDLEPEFYVPTGERDLVRISSAARPVFERGSATQHEVVADCHVSAYEYAWACYEEMRAAGVASEVARNVLPVGIYSSAFVTMNARALMNFLSLRVHNEGAAFVSYPLAEIQALAERMEGYLRQEFPLTHAAFVANGRVAP